MADNAHSGYVLEVDLKPAVRAKEISLFFPFCAEVEKTQSFEYTVDMRKILLKQQYRTKKLIRDRSKKKKK